jgi:hypothetical protein
MAPPYPVARLLLVRVVQSTVGVLIVLVGSAGVLVVAAAMILAGLLLGVMRAGAWTQSHRHAAVTGLVLAGATIGHTLAVLNAPVASVETVVQGGALLPLIANPVQRRRPHVVILVLTCVVTGGLFVGFSGGSTVGVVLAAFSGVCAAGIVMRLESPPGRLPRAAYQAVAITTGGFALLLIAFAFGDSTGTPRTLLVLVLLALIFAVTNLELGRVVPSTGAVIAMASSGLRPIAALLIGALAVDQRITSSALALAVAYSIALAGLVRASRRT